MDRKKTISVIRVGDLFYLHSNYTGEIVRPYEIGGIIRLIFEMIYL